ncbi:hypothetical protein ES705_33496 [subsurface metagenome]
MNDEKIYSQEELDATLVSKEDEITALKVTVKKLEEKIAADTKAVKEKEATVAAEKWWDENKDSYPEDKKDELIAIRKKIELGEVKKKEDIAGINALLNLNRGRGSGKVTGEQLDSLFQIEDASKVKVTR